MSAKRDNSQGIAWIINGTAITFGGPESNEPIQDIPEINNNELKKEIEEVLIDAVSLLEGGDDPEQILEKLIADLKGLRRS